MKQKVQIQGLEPNAKYVLQVRSSGSGSLSQWSTQLEFDTVVDLVPPSPVVNLDGAVQGADFAIEFEAPTTSADGSELDDLRDYRIDVWPDGQPGRAVVIYTINTDFIFTFADNKQRFGTPEPHLIFSVRARDRVGNLSAPAEKELENLAPGSFVLAGGAKRNAINLSWTLPSGEDLAAYHIYKNGGKVAEVGHETLVWTDTDPGIGAQEYFIRAFDVYGQPTDSNQYLEAALPVFELDTIAPKPPTGLSLTSTVEFNLATAVLTWDAPTQNEDDTSYSDHEGFEVRWRSDPSRPYNYSRVPDTRSDGSVAGSFSIEVTGPGGETMQWGVRAFDRSGNYSSQASSSDLLAADTTPPDPPTGVVASAGFGTIYVNWLPNSEPDLAYYEVEAADNAAFTANKVVVFKGLATSASFLSDSAKYVRVFAYDVAGNRSDPSNTDDATPIVLPAPDTTPPDNPSIVGQTFNPSIVVNALGQYDTYLVWDWPDNTEPDMHFYEIRYSTVSASGPWTYMQSSESHVRIGPLEPGTTLYLGVRAMDTSMNLSGWTATQTTIPSTVPVAVAPTVVAGSTGVQGPDFRVAWSHTETDDHRDYRVRVYPTATPANTRDYFTSDKQFTYTFAMNQAAFGTAVASLTFEIRAVNKAGGLGAALTQALANTQPGTFTVTRVLGQDSVVNLTWTEPSGGDIRHYLVQRKPGGSGTYATIATVTSRAYIDTPAAGSYDYQVIAVDMYNLQRTSTMVAANPNPLTVSAAFIPDTTPPNAPTALGGYPTTGQDSLDGSKAWIDHRWTATTPDPGDFSHYRVEARVGTQVVATQIVTGIASNQARFGNLAAGVSHSLSVRAVDNSGNASAPLTTTITTAQDTTPPAIPTLNAPSGAIEAILVSWGAVGASDLSHYELHMGTSAGFTVSASTLVYSGPATNHAVVLPANTTRHFRVLSVDFAGNKSNPSVSQSATSLGVSIDSTPPNQVTGVTTDQAATYFHGMQEFATIRVNWSQGSDNVGGSGIAGYVLGVREAAGSWSEITVGPEALQHVFTGLRPGVLYTFRVKALDRAGNVSTNWSTEATRTVASESASPVPTVTWPASGAVEVLGVSSIRFMWNPVSPPPTIRDYEITISTSSTFASGNTVYYTDGTAFTYMGTPGTQYWARVRARTLYGGLSGSYSATQTGTTRRVGTTDLTDGAVSLEKFASTLRPVQVVSTLPALPNATLYPAGAVISLTTDGKMYRSTGSAWTAAVPTADLTGLVEAAQINVTQLGANTAFINSLTATGISAAAIKTGFLGADRIDTASIAADSAFLNNLTVSNANIDTVSVGKLTGGNLSATDITVLSKLIVGTGGIIESANYSTAGNGAGYRISNTAIDMRQGSIILAGTTGLNINTSTNQLWFGATTFASAAFRVDSTGAMRVGTVDTAFNVLATGELRIGANTTTAPVRITPAGLAELRNVRIIPGTVAPINTNIIEAGTAFVVRHTSTSGVYETNIGGNLNVTAGGNINVSAGSINVSGTGSLNLSGGNIVVSNGRITNNLSYTGSGTGYRLDSNGILTASGAVISGTITVNASSNVYTKSDVYTKTEVDPTINRVTDWTFTGTTTIDGGKIRADSVTAVQIAAGSITIGPPGGSSLVTYASGYDPSTKATPVDVEFAQANALRSGAHFIVLGDDPALGSNHTNLGFGSLIETDNPVHIGYADIWAYGGEGTVTVQVRARPGSTIIMSRVFSVVEGYNRIFIDAFLPSAGVWWLGAISPTGAVTGLRRRITGAPWNSGTYRVIGGQATGGTTIVPENAGYYYFYNVEVAGSGVEGVPKLWQFESTTEIDGGNIRTNTIAVNKLAAGTLTVVADIGVGGAIRIGGATNPRILIDNQKIQAFNSGGTEMMLLDTTTNTYRFGGALQAASGTFTGELSGATLNLSGTMLLGGMIRTSASGARTELSSTGLRAYNSGGTLVTNILSSTGALTSTSATFTGSLTVGATTTLNGALTVNSGTITAGNTTLSSAGIVLNGGSINLGSGKFVVDNAGMATMTNARLTGTDLPNSTALLSAGTAFVVQKTAGGAWETRVAGNMFIDAGGNLTLGGGAITLTSGNFNMNGGTMSMAGGTMNLSGTTLNMTAGNINLNSTSGGNGNIVVGGAGANQATHSGVIKSSNYNFANKTGWALDNGNLYLFDGEIKASLITLQQSPNLLDMGYTMFSYDPAWYTGNVSSSGGATVSLTGLWSRYGGTSLRLQGGSGAVASLGTSNTNYNVKVEPSSGYIVSAYVRNNAAGARTFTLRVRQSNAAYLTAQAVSIPANTVQRVFGVITTAAGVTGMLVEGVAGTASSDFMIDGVQVEERVGTLTEPSFFKVGGVTTIAGGQITTGSIRSTNYVAGVSGFSIGLDGNVEFADGVFRGAIEGASVQIPGNINNPSGLDSATHYYTNLTGFVSRANTTGTWSAALDGIYGWRISKTGYSSGTWNALSLTSFDGKVNARVSTDVTLDLIPQENDNVIGVMARATTTDGAAGTITNGYVAGYGAVQGSAGGIISTATLRLVKIVNGTVTTLWTGGGASDQTGTSYSKKLSLEVVGDEVRLFEDGRLVASVQDSSVPGGATSRWGLAFRAVTGSFLNWFSGLLADERWPGQLHIDGQGNLWSGGPSRLSNNYWEHPSFRLDSTGNIYMRGPFPSERTEISPGNLFVNNIEVEGIDAGIVRSQWMSIQDIFDTGLDIRSENHAGVRIYGDMLDLPGEPGGAYVSFGIDGATSPIAGGFGIKGIIGMTNRTGEGPAGGLMTGTIGNNMVLGTVTNGSVQIVTNNAVAMTIAGNNNVTIGGAATVAGNLTVGGEVFASGTGRPMRGELIASTQMTSNGSVTFSNIPSGYTFFDVRFSCGTTATDIANTVLCMRVNGLAGADTYRYNFQDLGRTSSITTNNFFPVCRIGQGANRTVGVITIQAWNSWPIWIANGMSNWGATGSYTAISGGTVTDTSGTPISTIFLYSSGGGHLLSGSRFQLIGYRQ